MISMKNYKFIISGKVQGVYYRANIRTNAFNSKFNGYVRNLSDGTVEAAVSCEDSRLEQFIEILKKGSPASRVDTIKQLESNDIYTNDFEVR